MDVPTEPNDFGCIFMFMKDGHHMDLTKIPPNFSMVVYFHGGGLSLGDSYDHEGASLIQKLSEIMPDDKPIILASVDYSLAPELPFPTAVMEALTVVGHFCELLENHKIHLAGISAGGNLAAVASMEAFRKYPGRIRSSLFVVPCSTQHVNRSVFTSTRRLPTFVPLDSCNGAGNPIWNYQ